MSKLAGFTFYLIAVCTYDQDFNTGPCYDTLYENTTVIRCDEYDWGRDPYPWEWTTGMIRLGYYSSVTGAFVENYSFHYTWGSWNVVSGDNIQYVIGIDTNVISKSSFEGKCTEHTNRD